MWDAPVDPYGLADTPAEIAWRMFLLQTLVAQESGDEPLTDGAGLHTAMASCPGQD